VHLQWRFFHPFFLLLLLPLQFFITANTQKQISGLTTCNFLQVKNTNFNCITRFLQLGFLKYNLVAHSIMDSVAHRKWKACITLNLFTDCDAERTIALAVEALVVPLQLLVVNPLRHWIVAFDDSDIPRVVRLYLEFKRPRANLELPWEGREWVVSAATTITVVELLRFEHTQTNAVGCGPLVALPSAQGAVELDLVVSASMAQLCTLCGKAHPTDCGNAECSRAACTAPLQSLLACLSCGVSFCCRKCTDSHYCTTDGAVPPKALATAIAVRHSNTPFATPFDFAILFPGYRFGRRTRAVAERFIVKSVADVDACAAALCTSVGMYALFRRSDSPKYSIAARGLHGSVCRFPSTDSIAVRLAHCADSRTAYVKGHRKREDVRELILALTPTTVRTCALNDPMSIADTYHLHDAMKAFADDERALCRTIAKMFPPRFAALLNEAQIAMPLKAVGQNVAAKKMGKFLMRLFALQENRQNERLHEVACTLLAEVD
jgi:hypothetical protein